jgi:hypothetical protein
MATTAKFKGTAYGPNLNFLTGLACSTDHLTADEVSKNSDSTPINSAGV